MRDHPDAHVKWVCVLGAHCTGTNALLRELLRFFDIRVSNAHRADNPPFWKHTVFRAAPPLPRDTMCVCLVRDPGMWVQSLSRDPSDGSFYEIRPGRKVGTRFLEEPQRSRGQLFKSVQFDGSVYRDALALWEATVKAYFDDRIFPTAQTVVVRYEDFLHEFSSVLEALKQRGLPWRSDHPQPLEPLNDSAKDDTHPESTRRTRHEVLRDYANQATRFKGLNDTQKDRCLNFCPKLIDMLGYGIDGPRLT